MPGQSGKAADGIIRPEVPPPFTRQLSIAAPNSFTCRTAPPALDLRTTTGALGFARMPITEDHNGTLSVPCSLKKTTGRLALDTGAFVTVFDEAAVRDLS